MLDEAQVLRDETFRNGQHPLSALIVAINTLQEQELPIGLVLCGLPSFSSSRPRACTYSEWMFRGEQIGALGPPTPPDALLRPVDGTAVSITAEVVERVTDEVEGYPFLPATVGRRALRGGPGLSPSAPPPCSMPPRPRSTDASTATSTTRSSLCSPLPSRTCSWPRDMPIPATGQHRYPSTLRQERRQRQRPHGPTQRPGRRLPPPTRPVRQHRTPSSTKSCIARGRRQR
jgi:hypothetical protein